MKITSDKYDIYSSGTVISFKGLPTTFHLADDLRIKFVFVSNDTEEASVQFVPAGKDDLELHMVNFDSPLGRGIVDPTLIGELNDRDLYLSFIIYSLAQGGVRSIHYTWYLGDAYVDPNQK